MSSVHDFTVKTIEGRDKKLSEYKGHVLLIVNVASRCGFTPQYDGLERLHQQYRERGLRVLGFPANEFGAQEPGTNDEIKTFCTTHHGVTFDMFAKLKVKGAGIDPLFSHLTKDGGDIKWNFSKFLVGKNGELLGRFDSRVEPESIELKAAIDAALTG
jgi:glutathione peroxidase